MLDFLFILLILHFYLRREYEYIENEIVTEALITVLSILYLICKAIILFKVDKNMKDKKEMIRVG